MPETPINENCQAGLGEHEIGIAQEALGPNLPASYTDADKSQPELPFSCLVAVAAHRGHSLGAGCGYAGEHATGQVLSQGPFYRQTPSS